MKKYNALVIGLGKIGLGFDLAGARGRVLTHTKAYLMNKRFNLVAGIDKDALQRKAFARFSGRRAYGSVEEFIEDNCAAIDVVSLCTPPEIRLSEFSKIASIKPRLVMIEKPIATTVQEAESILKSARKAGIKIYVNYMRRIDPFFRRLKLALDRQEFGRPIHVDITYTGGLYKNASHFVDLMISYFGLPKLSRRINLLAAKNGDMDCSFMMRYRSFDVYFNCVPSDRYSVGNVDIFLSGGRVLVSDFGSKAELFSVAKDPVFRGFNMLRRRKLQGKPALTNYQAHVLEHIFQALKNNQRLLSDAGSAIETLSVCKKIENGD